MITSTAGFIVALPMLAAALERERRGSLAGLTVIAAALSGTENQRIRQEIRYRSSASTSTQIVDMYLDRKHAAGE